MGHIMQRRMGAVDVGHTETAGPVGNEGRNPMNLRDVILVLLAIAVVWLLILAL